MIEEEFRSQNSGAEPETSESSGQNQSVAGLNPRLIEDHQILDLVGV